MKRAWLVLLLAVLALPAMAQEAASPTIRNVTPPDITPGPKVTGPLERVPEPPPKARWWRFFLPETIDAATFRKDGKTIRIAGVEPPPVTATCPVSGGQPWPCGQTALLSLRLFLRGRAIECYFPDPGSVTSITAPCRVGTSDIGLWLLTEGWARPDDLATDQYRSAATAAVCAQRGVWRGQPPPADCPPSSPGSG